MARQWVGKSYVYSTLEDSWHQHRHNFETIKAQTFGTGIVAPIIHCKYSYHKASINILGHHSESCGGVIKFDTLPLQKMHSLYPAKHGIA